MDLWSYRLHERLDEMMCKRLCEMLESNMLHVYCRKSSGKVQESLNLSHLLSPDEGIFSSYFSEGTF